MHRSKAVIAIVVSMTMVLTLVGVIRPVFAQPPWYVDDDNCPGTGTQLDPFCTITAAVDAAGDGDTINVAAGTYPESVVIDKANLTVKGPQFGVDPTVAGARTVEANEAIITGDGANDYSVRIGSDVAATAGGTGVTFDGFLLRGETGAPTTRAVYANRDNPTISNNIIEVDYFAGDGIFLVGEHDPFNIDSATISQNYLKGNVTSVRAAIRVDSYGGVTIKNVAISGNKVEATGANFYAQGVMLARSTGTGVVVSLVSITDNHLEGVGGAGYAIDIFNDGVEDVTITGNTMDPWMDGLFLRAGVDATAITINCNNIFGNTWGVYNLGNGVLDAENNWWGCNAGPGAAGCDPVSANVDTNPWLVLNISANPASIGVGGSTSTITADMTRNSDGVDTSGLGYIPDGTEINFATNRGSVGSLTTTKTTTNGKAQATLTSSTTAGTATVTASAPPHTAGATATTTVKFRPGEPYTLTLTADPTSVPADGTSSSTITATVLDGHGNNVANGTQVLFSTDLGSLDSLGSTQVIKTTTNGIATATLTSGTVAGTATVTGFSAGVSDQTVVEFTWPYHLYLPLIVKSYTP